MAERPFIHNQRLWPRSGEANPKGDVEMKRFVMCVVLAVMFSIPSFASAFERFEAGARYKVVKMVDPDIVVGTINRANPENGLVPFIGVNFTPNWGVELSYNRLEAVAECLYPVEEGGNRRDGVFDLKGPAVSVIWRPKINSFLNPYGGIGAAYYFGGFKADGWWGNGFSSPSDYAANGPDSLGKTREMYVDDAIGVSAFVGADIKVWKQLYADFRVGYEKLATDVSFKGFLNGSELYSRGPYKDVELDTFGAMLAVKVKF